MRINSILIIVLFCLLASCKKKFVEIIPVIEIEKDMSIVGGGDIKYFSFPTANIGYAASSSSFIYKTINAGTTWSQINVASTKICRGLAFFDEDKGMCLMNNDVYVTDDGGQTWVIKETADFIGITESGLGVVGDCGNASCVIKTSINKGQTFQLKGSMNYSLSFDFRAARIVDSKVIILSNGLYSHGNENAFNLLTNTAFVVDIGGFNAYEKNNDIYVSENTGIGVLVGEVGLIGERSIFLGNEIYDRTDNGYDYAYYSVDGYNGLILCVGENTISTNMDIGSENIWNGVLDKDGNSFPNTFYKVRFINQNTFYISGSGGLILKATI